MEFLPEKLIVDVLSWVPTYEGQNVTYHVPNPNQSDMWIHHGFEETNDHSLNALGWYGLRLKMFGSKQEPLIVTLTCSLDRNPSPESLVNFSTTVYPEINQEVLIPFERFQVDAGNMIALKAITAVTVHIPNGSRLTKLAVIVAPRLAVAASVRGKPVSESSPAVYTLEIANADQQMISTTLKVKRRGWEVLPVRLEDNNGKEVSHLCLSAGERTEIRVIVSIHPRLAKLGSEQQCIMLVTEDGDMQTITFTTVRHSDDFHTTHTQAEIAAVKKKIAKYDWAKQRYEMLYQQADCWQVPQIESGDEHLFHTRQSDEANNASMMYLLSGEKRFAEKVAIFLKEIIDPKHGYFVTLKAGNQELVHEGEFFKHTALAYDHILHTGLLTPAECVEIELAFRQFQRIIHDEILKGNIGNWNLAELSGVIATAAVLEDLDQIHHFLYSVGGVGDHISKGILNDGWWFEASIGYNLLAMGLFLEISQIVDKWGFNLKHLKVPANYSTDIAINQKLMPISDQKDGLSLGVFGPSTNNYRSIEMLVDSMVPFFDESGVIFGMNDATETHVVGVEKLDPRYDLAYYIYRKSNYLPLLHQIEPKDRDLYYGIGELPPVQPADRAPYRRSQQAAVAGITLLRSQAPKRNPEAQYQVTLKAGLLGGAHGHYDRLALNSIRRFGRNFYNPENVWYAYHTFMYKFYVQNSIAHNMTTVDLKQQDVAETKTLAFETNGSMQYVVQEITTKWANPPYGGWRVAADETFADRAWNEGRDVPIPKDAPKYTRRSGYTEPILQRRALVVCDDFIVIIDYLKGESEHQFDFLLHGNGLKQLTTTDATRTYIPVDDPQDSDYYRIGGSPGLVQTGVGLPLDPSPLSSGQFITGCRSFDAVGTIKASFSVEMSQFNEGGWLTPMRTQFNEAGPLNVDVYSLAPSKRQILIGNDPEYWQIQQQLHYVIKGDNVQLAAGSIGTWIFGRDDLKLDISGRQTLTLTTQSTYVSDEYGAAVSKPLPAIFWGNGYVTTQDGEQIALNVLPLKFSQIQSVDEVNRDYAGGPVKLAGHKMATSIPGTPVQQDVPATVTIDLSGIQAKTLVVSIGGDTPIGDESDRRRTFDVRTRGTEASFVTVVEQYDRTSVISSVSQPIDNQVMVTLRDGRKQLLTIEDMTLTSPQMTMKTL